MRTKLGGGSGGVRGLKTAIAMAPPLVISREEVDTLLTAIAKTLDQL